MTVKTEAQLRQIYGDVSPVARDKGIDHLDKHCLQLIGASPFLVLATTDGVRMDASPKGDKPGFVQVQDGNLLIPDWPGNKRLDGYRNILKVPRVGVLFMIPNMRETLRVNGPASIHTDPELLQRFRTKDKLPISVLQVQPEEVFLHCAKAFMRSALWEPETWPDRKSLPGMGEMLRDHAKLDAPPYGTDEQMDERLRGLLY